MFLIIKAFAAKGATGEGVWRTINGSPVFIQGGKITKGPAKLVGSTPDDIEGSKKSASDRKEELKKKYGDKVKSSSSAEKKETSSDKSKDKEAPTKSESSASSKKEYSPNRFKSSTKEAKEKAERELQDPVKLQENKEHLAKMYAKGMYSDSMLRSVAMDNYGMSTKDYNDIVKMAGGKNSIFSDKVAADKAVRQSATGSFKSGGETYSYSSEGSYLVVKNSKGVEVAAEKVGVSSLGANASTTAKGILKATQANSGNALDVKSGSSSTAPTGGVFQTPKYPSGIQTASQKRTYTKAVNSGKSSSEATKIALGRNNSASPEIKKPTTTKPSSSKVHYDSWGLGRKNKFF